MTINKMFEQQSKPFDLTEMKSKELIMKRLRSQALLRDSVNEAKQEIKREKDDNVFSI